MESPGYIGSMESPPLDPREVPSNEIQHGKHLRKELHKCESLIMDPKAFLSLKREAVTGRFSGPTET